MLVRPSARAARTYSKLRALQKFGAHHADQRRPGKQHEDEEQDPEGRRDEGGENDEEIERRHRRPDVDEALEQEIGPAAEKALHRARRDADDRRDDGQDEPEEHRDAEAVDQPRHDVAALVVGAEPVEIAEDAIGIVDSLRIFGAGLLPLSWKAGRDGAGVGSSLLTVL